MLLWHVQLCLQLSLLFLLCFARGENCKFDQLHMHVHVRVQPFLVLTTRIHLTIKAFLGLAIIPFVLMTVLNDSAVIL